MICRCRGQQPLEQRDRPLLERLGQQRVVGVAEDLLGDVPGLVPRHALLVDQHAHQLGDGDGRVRVVELNGHLLREAHEVGVRLQVAPHDVGDGAGDEEVLLLEAQLLAGLVLIVRVEHLRDDLGVVLLDHRALVVAVVEEGEVELGRRARLPQAQGVDRLRAEARDRGVPGHAHHRLAAHPLRGHAAVGQLGLLDVPVEAHRHDAIGPHHLPGVAELEPLVGALHLVAAQDLLAEDAELVADAVAHRRHVERGQGVEEAASGTRAAPFPRGMEGPQPAANDRSRFPAQGHRRIMAKTPDARRLLSSALATSVAFWPTSRREGTGRRGPVRCG